MQETDILRSYQIFKNIISLKNIFNVICLSLLFSSRFVVVLHVTINTKRILKECPKSNSQTVAKDNRETTREKEKKEKQDDGLKLFREALDFYGFCHKGITLNPYFSNLTSMLKTLQIAFEPPRFCKIAMKRPGEVKKLQKNLLFPSAAYSASFRTIESLRVCWKKRLFSFLGSLHFKCSFSGLKTVQLYFFFESLSR